MKLPLPLLDLPPAGGTEPTGAGGEVHAHWALAEEVDASKHLGAGRIPHIVAWNLTRRCNLACSHCYISAGDWHGAGGELTTDECRRIADEILEINPSPLFILSGGEPLLRSDLEDIARHSATRGATVVVGTNGTLLTDARIHSLMEAGVTGVAVSVDSLTERYHDRFRHGEGALSDTLAAVERLGAHGLDFIVQTSVTRGNRREIGGIAEWAAEKGAVCFNVYFLVSTGRGAGMAGLTPAENDEVLRELVELERSYRGRMMVRSKCQPQIMRHVLESGTDSPLLNYETRCPCGVHYCRITPEGKVTPCPYMPEVAGDLRLHPFANVWWRSSLFRDLRDGELGGRCGSCEYRKVCGGCRARAFADSGDWLAEDAGCAYEPADEAEVIEPRRSVTYGRAAAASLPWDDDARRRIERVPSFVRGVVTARVEAFARERGHTRVTTDVMDEVRRTLPVDFSKRMPFFLRREAE